jgi:predicted aconitase
MHLTKEEEKILQGAYGLAKQEAMKKLVQFGDYVEAERMINISSAHIVGVSMRTLGQGGTQGGVKFLEDLLRLGPVSTKLSTLNPMSIDLSKPQELDVSESFIEQQLHIAELYEKMGCVPTYSCTPYYCGNLPAFGEHISWSETSAAIFANSVIGARTVRESNPTAIYASIVGKTCYYSYHDPENRKPTICVYVNAPPYDELKYSLIGYYVGKVVEEAESVPLFANIGQITIDSLKALGASMATTEHIDLYHIYGVTPEIQVMHFRKPRTRISISNEDLKQLKDEISTPYDSKVDFIALGCPHLSINELAVVSFALRNKKLRKGLKMWLCTSKQTKLLADRAGFSKIIEGTGAKIVCDTCMVVAPVEKMGISKVMTNSTKAAYYLENLIKGNVVLGNLIECCAAATSLQRE